MELAYIIAGKNRPYKVVTPIKRYKFVSEAHKKEYLCENPVIYQEIDGRVFSADFSQICEADFTKSTGNIGLAYCIPNEYIKEVAR